MAIYTSDSVFEKMEYQDFEVLSKNEWLQELAAHIEKQIEPDNGVWRDERSEAKQVECLPKEAKTLYYLWWFNVIAGGGGLDVFLDQAEANIVKGSYLSLIEIGADKLAAYLSDAIFMALHDEYHHRFSDDKSHLEWFCSLEHSGEFCAAEDVNGVFFDEFDVIETLSVEYVEKNMDILVEEA